jgi:hypothetical protein
MMPSIFSAASAAFHTAAASSSTSEMIGSRYGGDCQAVEVRLREKNK